MSDASQEELKIIRNTHENMTDETLHKAIRLTTRSMQFGQLISALTQLTKQFDNDPLSRVDLVCLEVYRDRLAAVHADTLEVIADGLHSLATTVPTNAYNIKEALEEFGSYIDPMDTHRALLASAMARIRLDPHFEHEKPIYNPADLEAEYSRGFEDGYQKALDTVKGAPESEVISQLDID